MANELLNQMVDEQDLSVRALACLRAAGIKTVRELVRMQKSDITRLRNFVRPQFDVGNGCVTEHEFHELNEL